jgi:hypothetical protein
MQSAAHRAGARHTMTMFEEEWQMAIHLVVRRWFAARSAA